MGEHHRNPRAIAAANGAFRLKPGDEVLGFQLVAKLELNKEKLGEAVAIIDAAKERGEDPRHAVPTWTPKENPEYFDYVVYNVPTVGRPSPLQIDPKAIPTATIQLSEHLRIPYSQLRDRADSAFAGAEPREETH